MTTLVQQHVPASLFRRSSRRAWDMILAAWGAVTGLLPHVLHHVGPLAGAAVLAGTSGRLLFAAIALAVSVPFLLRIRRRFKTWIAPAIALVATAATFSLSTFVLGPLIAGSEGSGSNEPGIQQPTGHASHHS